MPGLRIATVRSGLIRVNMTEPVLSLDEPTIRVDSVNHGYVSGDHVLGDINMELKAGSFAINIST